MADVVNLCWSDSVHSFKKTRKIIIFVVQDVSVGNFLAACSNILISFHAFCSWIGTSYLNGKEKVRSGVLSLRWNVLLAQRFLALLCKGTLHPDILSGITVLIWCLSEKVMGIHHVLFFTTVQNVTAWLCVFQYIGRIYFPFRWVKILLQQKVSFITRIFC